MTGPEILRAMENGSTLYSGRFGFWLMDVFNTRCTNVHHGAAKSLVRRKLIERVNDDQWGLPSKSERKKPEDCCPAEVEATLQNWTTQPQSALASESERTADEKPDGQAENSELCPPPGANNPLP